MNTSMLQQPKNSNNSSSCVFSWREANSLNAFQPPWGCGTTTAVGPHGVTSSELVAAEPAHLANEADFQSGPRALYSRGLNLGHAG